MKSGLLVKVDFFLNAFIKHFFLKPSMVPKVKGGPRKIFYLHCKFKLYFLIYLKMPDFSCSKCEKSFSTKQNFNNTKKNAMD